MRFWQMTTDHSLSCLVDVPAGRFNWDARRTWLGFVG